MTDSVIRQIAGLKELSHDELKQMYRSLHGSESPATNRDFLTKRIAFRIQEVAYGGLSQSAHEKMDKALARHGYDENGMPAARAGKPERLKDTPVIGSKLVREWNGRRYEVTTLRDGFEYEGRKFRSLSAIAKAITGTHWSGRAFFGLAGRSTR
jgi:hypothetical protein